MQTIVLETLVGRDLGGTGPGTTPPLSKPVATVAREKNLLKGD